VTVRLDHAPVRRAVIVRTPVEEAFTVFTEEIDAWWPRTHHIGGSPMRRIVMEGRAGGRCYTQHVDDTECDWGQVLVWEPPHRFVFAWRITHEWRSQPGLDRCSEVEVRFRAVAGGTRVEVEHRGFDRHGPGGDVMRSAVDAQNGWTTVLARFTERANRQDAGTPGGGAEP
jgi:uncharacterized protein YndB with AHSA1/START domain